MGRGQHSKYTPKAFTEKGLYMLATILKSPKATQTTLAIIETFTKIRELSRTMSELSDVKDDKKKNKLMQKSGNLIAETSINTIFLTLVNEYNVSSICPLKSNY